MLDADVIVVGSGHNGLVCAAYLAKWGYRVLVLERRDTIGGAVCTEEMFGGYQMDVGGSDHFMIHHTPIVSDLDLEAYGLSYIPMDPFMCAPFPDGDCICFYRDLDRTCESIARVDEADAEAYYRFITDWQPLNESVFDFFRSPPTLMNFGRNVMTKRLGTGSTRGGGRREARSRVSRTETVRRIMQSYGALIRGTFRSEKMRAALEWWGAQSGPPPMDTASAEFIGWHSVVHKIGPARPRGGSGMLTQALAACIRDHGGTVVAESEVASIDVRGGRPVGVTTVDGTSFSGRAVVSNAHVRITFERLLADWTPPSLRERVATIRVGNGFGMVIRCAMESLPRYASNSVAPEEIVKGIQLLCPSTDYFTNAYADFLHGVPAENPAAVAMTFSAIDPELAPPGKHTLFVWGQYYPYRLAARMKWDEIRDREAKKLLDVVERYAPGTKEARNDWLIQSPEHIARKHAMPNANVMHVEMSLDQMFMFRPLPELAGYTTPLPGLYLASAGMHPGGGIFGAAGYNCAHVLRRDLHVRNRLFRAGIRPVASSD